MRKKSKYFKGEIKVDCIFFGNTRHTETVVTLKKMQDAE